jgi:hypothetical protein
MKVFSVSNPLAMAALRLSSDPSLSSRTAKEHLMTNLDSLSTLTGVPVGEETTTASSPVDIVLLYDNTSGEGV